MHPNAGGMLRPTAAALAALLLFAAFAPAQPGRAADTSTITISQGVDADTLNPIDTTITPTNNVVQHVFERLVDYGDKPGQYVGRLATSWKRVSPNVEQYTLRRNVKFSNGDPFTAADVKFSVDYIKDPKNASKQTSYVREIDKVETPDPYTVLFISNSTRAIAPGLTYPIFIVDSKYFMSRGRNYMDEHPIGTGPYVLREWHKDDQMTFDVNPTWWGGKPKIEHVVFKPIPEAAARVAALKTGAADLITNVPVQYATSIEGGTTTKMASTRSLRQLFIAFNLTLPGPQQNKLVRQAMSYAVNVPAIVKSVLGGRGYELTSMIPPNYFGYDASVPSYTYDPAKAKALLAQAGFPDGKGLSVVFNTPTGRYNRDREVAEALAGQLTAVGITVSVKPQEWTTYSGMFNRKALTPLYELGWNAPAADADGILTPLFESGSPTSTYKNEAVDKMIAVARGELDIAKRKADYKQIATALHDDAAWIVLFEYEDLYGANKKLVFQPRGDESLRAYEMSFK